MALAAIAAPTRSAAGAHLAFLLGGERVAIPLSRVGTVVRPPEVTDLPLSPGGVLGLANLRGTVTAIVALHEPLGLPSAAITDRSRVIVVAHGTPIGLLVDQILGILDIDLEELDAASADDAPVAGDLLAGISGGNGGEATLVLELDRALDRIFAAAARPAPRQVAMPRPSAPVHAAAQANERVLVSFETDGEEYAVPIASVREIVALPAGVSRVPHARQHVLGVVTLRDRLVPLVSARTLLGLPAGDPAGQRKVLVLSVAGEATVGLVVDRPRQILRVDEAAMEPVPPLLARDMSGDIDAICRLDGGRRLVAIISPGHLLRSDAVIQALAADSRRTGAAPQAAAEDRGTIEQFIGFRIGRSEYGLPIDVVEEVVGVPEHLTPIPKAPAHVAGIVNRRGAPMPVIDQRRRFDLPAADTPARHIVVVAVGASRVGFLVDTVTAVLKIPAAAIGPAPELSSEQARLISRVASLDERMILLLSPEHMVSAEEVGALAEAASGAADGAA